jgi:hypothetical protein
MKFVLSVAILLISTAAIAQMPYAGLQTRQIKALSEQQIADLRAGRGMGLALPAELNGYPGPSHLLELADQLGLRPEQRTQIATMFANVKAEAIPLGERLIEQEVELEKQFASRTANQASLEQATASAAKLQGELRAAHLKYHLLTIPVLDKAQLDRYSELRGYAQGAPVHQHRH